MIGTSLLQCERVDPFGDPSWDREVLGSEQHQVFHLSAWARVCVETYGHRPHYLRFQREGKPVACLPLLEVASFATGLRAVSTPFADLAGCLSLGAWRGEGLRQSLIERIRANGWRYLELRGSRGLETDPDAGGYRSYLEHELDLTEDPETMMSRFEPSTRRAIRKAERSGLETSVETSGQAVREFYDLHQRTRRRHGLPPQPWRFFESISRFLIETGLGWVVLARRRSRAIAGAVFLGSGRHAIYKFGASDPQSWDLRPNQAVMWTAIRSLVERGFRKLHFGRTAPGDEGLARFKASWGAVARPLWYHRLDATGSWLAPRTSPSEAHTWLFGHLPLGWNRLAGRLLYPHLD